MRLYKLLTVMLLFTLVLSVQVWSAEPLYTRAQVDSIVAAEVARQLKDQQIELQIERVSNEKYANSLDAQNNRLVEHDHKMSSRYTWIGVLITLISALFGVGGPLLLRKDSKEILEAIADNNIKALDNKIEEHDGKINDILSEVRDSKSSIKEVESKVNELAAGAEKARNEAEESAKQAKASENFSQALAEKDLDKKIELYTKTIDLKPDYAVAYNNRGWAYDGKREFDEAIADYTRAIKLNPNYATAYCNRGATYLNKGEDDKAIADFNKAIELEPDFVEVYNNRGVAYFHKREYDNAITDFNKAIDLKTDNADAYNNRGELRYKTGDYKGAIEDCSRAIELNPDGVESESYYHRGLSYKALGGEENLKLALTDAQKGLEVARRLGGKSLIEVEKFENLIKELEREDKG